MACCTGTTFHDAPSTKPSWCSNTGAARSLSGVAIAIAIADINPGRVVVVAVHNTCRHDEATGALLPPVAVAQLLHPEVGWMRGNVTPPARSPLRT